MNAKSLLSAAALAVMAAATVAIPADARTKHTERGSVVTGCSRFGHGCISGAVRVTSVGREVRMPGGTWIDCAGDCRDKLREQTVDFWDEHQHQNSERPH